MQCVTNNDLGFVSGLLDSVMSSLETLTKPVNLMILLPGASKFAFP